METKPYADFSQLLEELSIPLANKSTGTFFIATDDNSSCRFAIQDGEITHCHYKREQGNAAILSIKDSLRGRAAFSVNKSSLFKDAARVEHAFVVEHLGLTFPETEPEIVEEVTPEENPPPQDTTPEMPKSRKRTYRGQEILEEIPSEDNKHEPAAETKKKPPRMYRGQIIDD